MHDDAMDALSFIFPKRTGKFRWGFLARWGSAWMGAHWSPFNKRLCVNLIPFCTVWFVWPGGIIPTKGEK